MKARLSKHDPDSILCGATVGRGHCQNEIARRYTINLAGESSTSSDAFILPDGLTDHDTPAHYRWSSHSLGRMVRSLDRRPGPYAQSKPAGLAGSVAVALGEVKGFRRIARTPATVPCRSGHESAIDSDVLVGMAKA